jgi:hypothetical protein
MEEVYIKFFVEYVLENPEEDELMILDYLIEKGVPEPVGFDIVVFTVEAFSQKYWSGNGIRFSEIYIVKDKGELKEYNLADNIIFQKSLLYYDHHIDHKISEENLLPILHKSSLFNAVVNSLENKSNLSGLICGPTIIDLE